MSITRRTFLGTAGALSATAAVAATPALADAPEIPEGPVEIDWVGTEPADPEEFAAELEADVIVVGLGWAGCCATRAACEEGVSVLVFEKGESFGLPRQNVNAWGSKFWLSLFPETEKYWDKQLAMNAVMQSCLNRNSDAIQSKWFDTNGMVFDWFFEAMEGTGIIYGTAENPVVDTTELSMTETSYPYPANYDPAEEYYPCFPGCAKCFPSGTPYFEAQIAKAEEAAGDKLAIYRNTPVIKLVKEDDRITGVIAEGEDGFIKAIAKNGVVLATGDYINNKLMVNATLSRRFPEGLSTLNSLVDADGNFCDMGDGQRMGVWAGAKMQLDGVNMSHAIGGNSYTMGTLPTLFLNKFGKRFMNEDVQGQQFAERIWEQKDCIAYQIYDAGFFDHMADMPYGHGKHPEATLEQIQADAEAGKLFCADTIEELIEQLDIDDKEAALASIAHYNELCHTGADTDFGKVAKRMIPVEVPPFFCDRFAGDGTSRGVGHLVTMSGLESDEECHVYDTAFDVIPGLYACGNVQGNRFAVIYPEVLQGHSIAMAMTFGYIAGKNAAAGV